MIRSYRAEMVKLVRRRVLLATALTTVVFALGGAATVLAAAEPATAGGTGRTPSIEGLAAAGGGTEVFRVAAAFAGTFLFVVFVGAMAAEHGRGTLRTSLLRQPRRVRLLAGRLAAILTFAAITLAAAQALTWVAARVLAPGNGVDPGAWASVDGLVAAAGDLGAVLLWVTGYAVIGTTVGLLVRSVPVALAVAIGWAGPFEHLLQDAWEPASRVLPGLLLEAFVTGGTDQVAAGRALGTAAAYTVVAAVVGAVVLARRDVAA